VLIINVSAQRAAVDPTARLALYEQAREAVRVVPGVAAASLSMLTPLNGAGYFNPDIQVLGPSALPEGTTSTRTYANIISPGWFDTMGTPVVAGRDFTNDDRRDGRPIVIVNETWARTFLNGANPLGHTITVVSPYAGTPMEIVGLVADAVYVSLRDAAPPTMYIPLVQFDLGPGSLGSVNLSVRSTGEPRALQTRSLASALIGVNPGIDLRFRPLADHVQAALSQERLVAAVSTVFGILAVVLAALGIYGITAYGIMRRRHEIAIRMALGARRLEVLALVLRRSIAITMVGLTIGIGGAAAVTRYLEGMLFGLTPLDPVTFLGASLLFAAVATLASYVPARRATAADPVAVLRSE
jgi:predicted permease